MQGRVKVGEPSAQANDTAAPGARTRPSQPTPAAEGFFRDALGMSIDEFLLNAADQRPHGPHASAARLQVANLAVMADIDYMMSNARFRATNVQPLRQGLPNPDRRAIGAGGSVEAAYIYGLFAKGTGIRFIDVDRYLPRVAGFAAELSAALANHVGANIYLTPANGEGLAPHYDSHDVFVVQCVGTKRWRLYADRYANAERPTETTYTFDPKRHLPGQVDREFDMTPGDILYLPRGIMHEAAPPSGDSLHVTFGLHTLTIGELVRRALRLATKEVKGLRDPVPHAVRLTASVDDELAAEIATVTAAALAGRHLTAALGDYRRECLEIAPRAPAGHWFGSHQGTADGLASLGAALADRIRNHEIRISGVTLARRQPKTPRREG